MQKYVDCYAGLIEGGKMYIPDLTYAFLLEYDLKNWERRRLFDFTGVFKELPIRVMAVFKENEHIYLVLRNTFRILECNLKTGQVSFIGEQPVYEDSKEIIIYVFRTGDEIWSIPLEIQNSIQIFNIKSRSFTELPVSEYMSGYGNVQGFLKGAFSEDYVYLPVYGDNFCSLICQIGCKDKAVKLWPLAKDILLNTLSSYKGEIWLSDLQNPVFPKLYRWNKEEGIQETIYLDECKWRETDNPGEIPLIREIIAYREKLIVIPHCSGQIIIIDRKQKSQRRLLYPDDFRRVAATEAKSMFLGFAVQNEQVFLFPCAYNGLLILNMETEELEFHELCICKEEYKPYYKSYYQEKRKEGKPFSEGEFLSYDRGVFSLMEYIEQVETEEMSIQSGDKAASGKRIYDFLTVEENRL